MRHLHRLCCLATIAALSVASPLWAGVPAVVGITSIDDAYLFQSPVVGTPVTTTITLNFNALGTTGLSALLSALTIGGTNASDFAITGGTCMAGSTRLDSGNGSCTVIVKYTPPSTAAETALLAITCSTTVTATGGFSLICTNAPPNGNSSGSISLLGSALAAFTSVPAPILDPRLLTLLSVMLLGIGVYFAARRNA